MRNSYLKTVLFGAALAIGTMASCDKDKGPDTLPPSGPDIWDRQYITLTLAFPDDNGEAGNGGTRAYAITTAQAADPNFEVDAFNKGYVLRSQRTARVQGSRNGNFLYNIQYVGNDGGIFNKYRVNGAALFDDTREELDTEPILGQSPRWVVAAEGIGIGVHGSSKVEATGEGADANFVDVKSIASIAVLNLDNPEITRQVKDFTVPFTAAQTKDGYQITRIDVPVLNAAKTKIFIGCSLSRIDKNKKSTMDPRGQSWSNATNELGTATLVVDYPSLTNPKLIFSANSAANNNSYRTMSQYLAEDGYIYQATATSGSQILRINGTTGEYDQDYNFDLKTDLGGGKNVSIRAWRYVKNGTGVVLYTIAGTEGGFVAYVDLNSKKATKLNGFENETDIGFSGKSKTDTEPALTGTFAQFQHIGVDGNKVYIPFTPNGKDGNLYIVDMTTKPTSATKGAKLKNASGSFYLGAY